MTEEDVKNTEVEATEVQEDKKKRKPREGWKQLNKRKWKLK